MLAVGEHLFGRVDDEVLKLTTGFAGGIGGTQHELCGGLSAGIMLIGGLYGRARPEVDDRRCQALAAHYRDQFVVTFGTTCCRELRQTQRPCALLVERISLLLLETIEEDRIHAQDHVRD